MRWHRLGIRARAALGVRGRVHVPAAPPAGAVWHALATLPGDEASLPWGSAPVHPADADDAQFRDALAHRFRVLAPREAPFVASPDAEFRARFDALAAELPTELRAGWRPIEWHADVHRGYRWDPRQLYIDVRLAPVPGADIKIPRELSRFNHVGALARGDRQRGADEFLMQALDWIAANPLRRGANWACTMDVALRALNWVWGLRLFQPWVARYPRALQALRTSLWEHGAHIEHHLEYYEELTNNHYLSDVAGLMHIAAAFPEFPESDRWLRFCLQELVSEMERETFTDGACHEASTHYHRLVAELFATCAALAERLPAERRVRLARVRAADHRVRPPLREVAEVGLDLSGGGRLLPQNFYERLARMADFTAALVKPNGLVPQFGDNDSGRAHKLLGEVDTRDHRHVVALIDRLTGRAHAVASNAAAQAEARLIAGGPAPETPALQAGFFPAAGVAVASNDRAWLAVTCGANGLGGRGGHGHNDKLSFELNVGGIDYIVDGGCPAYTGDPALRNRFRATAAHSTLVVAGLEQEPLPTGADGLFRLPQQCARTLRVPAPGHIEGMHDGYGEAHERRFTLEPQSLYITDRCLVARARCLRFNLDPGVEPRVLEGGGAPRVELRHGGHRLMIEVRGARGVKLREGCFSAGFGLPIPTRALSFEVDASETTTVITWE